MSIDATEREPRVNPAVAASAWHAQSTTAVMAALGVDDTGLSEAEAARRLAEHGPNELPRKNENEALRILLAQIHNPLIYVLTTSTLLAMLTGKYVDGLVIFSVVIVNTLIGFIQEYRANAAIKALSQMVPTNATIVRDGQTRSVPARELVPGDMVMLQSGDKVPADLRLSAARSLMVEEAALTGESVPVEKSVDPVGLDAAIGDRRSMAYGGTLVTFGTGRAVVVATGGRTELGRISAMLEDATEMETPMTRQLGIIGRWISMGVILLSVVLLVVGLLRGYSIADAILAAVTLAVGAVPEGLPAIVTIAMAIGVRRMANRHAIIRKLPAVETLGSTTVVCSDKTGTLTRNEMTVQELSVPEGSYRLSGVGYEPKGQVLTAAGEPLREVPAAVAGLLQAGVLCNDAALAEQEGTWTITGDPTEGALVVAARKAGLDPERLRQAHPRLDAIPFESERQFMATLHRSPEGTPVVYLKGAPEVVLSRCAIGEAGGAAAVRQEVEQIAAQGMRVLAFACLRPAGDLNQLDEADVASGLQFLGLQGMIDPPRPEAIAAIEACKQAGVQVKMITGDHRATARAIGVELGLIGEGDGAVTGAELQDLSGTGLREVATKHHVFARVAPEHKLRLVEALQQEGNVVAMTGDGVNDAPALKQANIGVAMGITGTAVTKETADMVLTDDNFASIEAAIEEGRRVYDNLIKALAFVLPTNLGLAILLSVAVAFFPIVDGMPLLPMMPTQILWINLIASAALGLPLAFEAMERDIMRRPPRRPDAPVLSPFIISRTVIVAILQASAALVLFMVDYRAAISRGLDPGIALAEAQTMAVTTMILFQVFYLLNCRSLRESIVSIGLWSNPWIYVGIGALLLLQAGFIYLPFMNAIFDSAPLGVEAWLEALLAAVVILPVISVEKWWRQRRAARKAAAVSQG